MPIPSQLFRTYHSHQDEDIVAAKSTSEVCSCENPESDDAEKEGVKNDVYDKIGISSRNRVDIIRCWPRFNY
jgi:hypothetical protein